MCIDYKCFESFKVRLTNQRFGVTKMFNTEFCFCLAGLHKVLGVKQVKERDKFELTLQPLRPYQADHVRTNAVIFLTSRYLLVLKSLETFVVRSFALSELHSKLSMKYGTNPIFELVSVKRVPRKRLVK